jgi:drug/metabolite transporter (DMT)-like permease
MFSLIAVFLSGLSGAFFASAYKLRRRMGFGVPEVLLWFSLFYLLSSFSIALATGQLVFERLLLYIGAAHGLTMILSVMCYAYVMERAKLGITWTIIQFSVLIPFFLSILLYGERPEPVTWSGIFCIFLAIVLFSASKKRRAGARAIPDAATGLLLGLSSLLTGVTMGIPKVYAATFPELQVFPLLIYSSPVMVLITLPIVLVRVARRRTSDRPRSRGLLPFAAYMSVTNQAAAVFLIVAVKGVPGSVVYPLRNVVNILLVFLVSIFVFRERISPSEGIGTAVAVAGIAVLSASSGG